MSDADEAGSERFGRTTECRGNAVDDHTTAVGGVDPHENLAKRRFAGTVLADERVHLAGTELNRHVTKCCGRAEALADTGGNSKRFGHGHVARAVFPCGNQPAHWAVNLSTLSAVIKPLSGT